MTTGDIPNLILDNLIDNPINPFSGNKICPDKENGVTIATSNHLQYTINNNQWLHVDKNIFDSNNWNRIYENNH